MDEFTTIKLLKSKGESIRGIAKAMKMSKNTVKKYLQTSDPPEYHVKPQNNENEKAEEQISKGTKSKWQKYSNEIIDMYYNKKFIGSRIFKELKEKGAEGSLSGFHEFFKKIKDNDVRKKVRARFETGPGKQMQFDWSDYVVKIKDETRKIYVFRNILCFSRYKHHIASYNKNQNSVFESMERAFEEFGGSPEEVLSDNAKQMVINPRPGNFQWNQQYIRFLSYYGVEPRVCRIRHSWTKGKVENPFKYLEEHFIKGGEFASLEDLNNKLKNFTDEWNKRKHTGINDIPYERYKSEKEYLKELPVHRYLGIESVWAKVSNDCLLSYGANKYSVPYVYAFNHVWAREKLGDKIEIYSQKGKLIAEHQIPQDKGNVIMKEEHYDGLKNSTPCSAIHVKKEFLKYFAKQAEYLEKISAQKRTNWKRHIIKIIELKDIYKTEDVKEALSSGIKHNVFSYDYVLAYMREKFDINYQEYCNHLMLSNKNIEDDAESGIKRDLEYYEEIR